MRGSVKVALVAKKITEKMCNRDMEMVGLKVGVVTDMDGKVEDSNRKLFLANPDDRRSEGAQSRSHLFFLLSG